MAISPEKPQHGQDMASLHKLKFDVLTDNGNQVAKQFGLVFTLPAYLRPVYKDFGISLPASNGDDSFQLPVPATYVIDSDGRIAWAFINTDHTTRAEPADVLRALRKLQRGMSGY